MREELVAIERELGEMLTYLEDKTNSKVNE